MKCAGKKCFLPPLLRLDLVGHPHLPLCSSSVILNQSHIICCLLANTKYQYNINITFRLFKMKTILWAFNASLYGDSRIEEMRGGEKEGRNDSSCQLVHIFHNIVCYLLSFKLTLWHDLGNCH